VHRTTNKQKLG